MTRMSNADYVRRVARRGITQPFYDALRLGEAADRLDQLEFENARLLQAVDDVMAFLHVKGIQIDELLESRDAEAIVAFSRMMTSMRVAVQPSVALPQPEVSGEYDPRTKSVRLNESPSLESRMGGGDANNR